VRGVEKRVSCVDLPAHADPSHCPRAALPSGDAALLFKQQQIERYAKQERETVVMMRVEQSQAEQVSWRAPRLRFRVFSRFFVDFFRRFPFAVQTTVSTTLKR